MIFWFICAVMTFAAIVAVLFPYLGNKAAKADPSDIEVYKDQLNEIEADKKRGLIAPQEADTARVEISRRILKADQMRPPMNANSFGHQSKIILICVMLSIPVVSWGLYLRLGTPDAADHSIVARLSSPPENASIEVLVAGAEAHLAANPGDGQGWEVLAPIYFRLGRFEDSIKAYEFAGKLNGPAVRYEIGIGQAWAGLNGGKINDVARAAFKRAAAIDPSDAEPKLLVATGLAQEGRLTEAKIALENILANAPVNAPWRGVVTDMISRVENAIVMQEKSQTPGPTQSDIEEAAGMSGADRTIMIEGMVAQLDAKLAVNPSDVEGWKRLLKAYSVLKKREKALEAFGRAKIGLKDNPDGLSAIKDLAAEIGIAKP
jgi:cytochrome c-type biogenesis protein CcmH